MRLIGILSWSGLALASTLHHPAYHVPTINSPGAAPGIHLPTSQQPNFTYNELYDLQKRFLDHFVYPANVQEVG